MMNDEMNIHDEFEDWLKQSADKHKMYPSDKLWRNINEQLHEQPNWPALTFGAILTLALITATLIFLHPNKDLFFVPNYAYSSTSKSSVTSANNNTSPLTTAQNTNHPKAKNQIYAFNSSSFPSDLQAVNTQSSLLEQADAELPSLTNESGSSVSPSIPHPPTQKLIDNTPSIILASAIKINTKLASVDTVGTTVAETVALKATEKAEKELPIASLNENNIQLPESNKKRWYVEVYGGSNISYRQLSESANDNYHAAYSQPSASDRENLNTAVNQRPSIGVNAGAAFVYVISDRFRIKAGVQFNFRQYIIDAYKSNNDRSTLLLNNGYYYPDSVYTFSAIGNEQGKAITLGNRYYQIGIPVGLEWTAVKLPKVSFNLAANIQPTYQINSNNYLLTSDYKNYVQAPGLLRRININAGFEATANFNAGNLQWQVGPQVLYQTLPSQKANYSIHEHLIDYGIRVGIIKRL